MRYRIRTSRDPQAIEHLRRWGRPASAAEILEPCQAMLNNDEFWGDAAVSNTLEMELEQRELEPGELTSLDEFGSTRLHDAPNPCWAGRLLAAGADVGAPNARGQTALHTAYDVEVVRLLLEHGADPNVQDENGSSPLHIHAEGWSLDIVRALLDGGAVVELKDKEGRTPLEKAEQGGPSVNAEIVTLLKKHAAR